MRVARVRWDPFDRSASHWLVDESFPRLPVFIITWFRFWVSAPLDGSSTSPPAIGRIGSSPRTDGPTSAQAGEVIHVHAR